MRIQVRNRAPRPASAHPTSSASPSLRGHQRSQPAGPEDTEERRAPAAPARGDHCEDEVWKVPAGPGRPGVGGLVLELQAAQGRDQAGRRGAKGKAQAAWTATPCLGPSADACVRCGRTVISSNSGLDAAQTRAGRHHPTWRGRRWERRSRRRPRLSGACRCAPPRCTERHGAARD